MESKTLDSVLRTAEIRRNPEDEMPKENRTKNIEEGYGNREVELKRNYEAVSKNGDTLELSEDGKRLGENKDVAHPSGSAKKIISDSGKKMSDSILTGCSEAKLKQLYADKKITKQQYDRLMKKKNKA